MIALIIILILFLALWIGGLSLIYALGLLPWWGLSLALFTSLMLGVGLSDLVKSLIRSRGNWSIKNEYQARFGKR